MMKYQYWLSNAFGNATTKSLYLYRMYGSARNVYEKSEEELIKEAHFSEEEAKWFIHRKKEWNLDFEWNRFLELGIGFVTLEQEHFPVRLTYLNDCPYALFYIGSLPDEDKLSIAIVGARTRSAYGESITIDLAEALGERGIPVISGMANGIDADAHKGCMNAGGLTYAVLGCGVDQVYPRQNRYLYDKIIASGGGIISEFPIGTQPAKNHFPQRNRIISGLSDCIVVMEARKKSGSLITADFGMAQGKEIYALPGRICDPLSEGCNSLIHDGCGTFLSVDDFLADLGFITQNKGTKKNSEKNILEKEERLLYSLIDFTPTGIHKLMQETSFTFLQLMQYLESMKEKEVIIESPANYFVRAKIL